VASVSSHVLDSVSGKSARGIRCQLFRLDGAARHPVFDVRADAEGRINETLAIDAQQVGSEYELVLHAAEYFGVADAPVSSVVLRFVIADSERRYHLPVMLAPHSYSAWWS